MWSLIRKHFQNSMRGTPVFLHTQIVNQTAFNQSDEIIAHSSHKTDRKLCEDAFYWKW